MLEIPDSLSSTDEKNAVNEGIRRASAALLEFDKIFNKEQKPRAKL